MKYFILIFICTFQIAYISSNYTFEIIEELLPNYATFDLLDFNSFKIFKYIPQCTEYNNNYNRSIYAQLLMNYINLKLYLYDNFSNIEQNEDAGFINYLDYRNINNMEAFQVESFDNLFCGKEYYFVISLASKLTHCYTEYFQFTIIDESTDIINISPLKSDSFAFIGRKSKEIIQYLYNETKYVSFFFSYEAGVKIFKNNEVIYDKKKDEPSYKDTIEFEKNITYIIHFEGNSYPLFSIQFFDQPKIFKVDFKNGPISLYYKQYYYYEIDISNYLLNDIILFKMDSDGNYRFSYQYKKDFHGNNFIDIGLFERNNYIPIKKTIEDSSLILFIEFHIWHFSLLNIIKDVEVIKSEFKKEIVGPKVYYIDSFEFNNMNSIGIEASESLSIYEQEKSYKTTFKSMYQNIYITTTNNNSPEIFKRMFIKLNTNRKILLEIKKFNYPIFWKGEKTPINDEFFQLCQGENPSNELYFFIESQNSDINPELFLPIFGSFDSYFIKEEDIHNLSDLDFENKTPNCFQTYESNGYLKIKCEEPTMFKHFNIHYDNDKNLEVLNSGRKYYISNYYITNKNFTFNSTLVNNELNLKLTIYGLEPEKSIKLIFNNNTYIYTMNNNSHEYNYKYEKYISDIFHFELDEEIENLLIGEIIVGILPKDIKKMFRQINFEDIFGNLTLQEKEGVVIKMPKNFTEEFYNFSIIFPGFDFYVDISYDKLDLMAKFNRHLEDISPVIPLFQVNPYDYIKDNSIISEEKFFFIYIINEYNYEQSIYIKKPKIYSDVEFNKINILPQLDENNLLYYYQLKIPEPQNNNYILVQSKRGGFPQKMSYSKNNILYPFLDEDFYSYFNIPYDKRDKSSDVYLNYYDVQETPGYINFLEVKEKIYKDYSPLKKLNLTVVQLKGKNILRVKLNSLSYLLLPNHVKYYFIINIEDNFEVIYSMVSGHQKPDKNKFEFLTVIEDDGANAIFQTDIKIDINLKGDSYASNEIFCIPIDSKTNYIEVFHIEVQKFEYENLRTYQKNKTLIWVTIVSIIFIIVITIIICYFKRCRKSAENIENNVLNTPLNSLEIKN